MATESLVLYQHNEATATLVLNRPAKRNAMSDELLNVFVENLERAIADEEVRTIVIAGAGDCFSAGRDRKDVGTAGSPPVALEDFTLDRTVDLFTNALLRLMSSPKPTVAAVHGFAFGGGQAMSLACDFLVAERHARFGNVEISYGFPAALNSVLLARHLGRRRAMEIAMIGEIYTAEDWNGFGLVNRLAQPGELDAATAAFVQLLNLRAPWAVQRTKALIRSAEEVSLEAGMTMGGQLNQLLRLNAQHSDLYREADAVRARIQGDLAR